VPELPEVDHARATLQRWLSGRVVSAVRARPGAPVDGSAAAWRRALSGATASRVERRGKHLLVPFRRGGRFAVALHLHLGMTGRVVVCPAAARAPSHARLTLVTADGQAVHLQDPRRFGVARVVTARRLGELAEGAALGPDPVLDAFGPAVLARALAGTSRPVKDVLLDQSRLAGVGNIYATEALWRARVHPARPADALARGEVAALAEGVSAVLAESLAAFRAEERRRNAALRRGEADAFLGPLYLSEGARGSPFDVYARAGQPCRRCSAEVESLVIAGRTSAFCPRCQR